MPELPEVEVVRRELSKLVGGRIVRLVSSDKRIVKKRIHIVGRKIAGVERRGKWLRIPLDEGFVFAHLGMTGDWTVHDVDEAALPFERVRVDVARGRTMASARYTDPRRFGRFITTDKDLPEWNALGPDPFLEKMDLDRLARIMKKRRSSVKETLMDQSVLAGIGNILATEALFLARIDPRTPSNRANARDLRAIEKGIRTMIEKMLEYDEGKRARAPFRIYGQRTCPRCDAKLRHVVLGGRSSIYCPRCQKRHSRK